MTRTLIVAASALLVLGACGEKPQDMAAGKKPDTPGWQGVEKSHTDPDFKAGDRKAWEEHLRARTQRGQNEYSRGTGKS